MTSTAPIGAFDSGLGGISVVKQIRQDLPNEHVIFFGDSAHAPYGTKTPEQVRELSFDIVEHLVQQGAKAIVIACNTATSSAVQQLREHYSIPIIGMEPALKVACDRGHGERQTVIVAATPLTLREKKFAALMHRFENDHTIYKQPCPKLVEIVEHGQLDDHDLVMSTLHEYFSQYDLDSVDSVVLGCTHFVFYRDYFRELLPDHVAIIDGNEGTAHHLHVVLESLGELAPEDQQGSVQLANSDTSPRIAALANELLNRPL
ncbi:glutamate racemase [Bifidobacterium canis]|uniref:Glutamate racemase n=1 Tax=Bifidobacterium canis TaxID=2610880 RepID=A0A7K1J2N2_9BIFI|nr:glutamate racemase [Bifidobacterium canis]MUH58735.1 glutamate racemase [Bifidobacterium canis]